MRPSYPSLSGITRYIFRQLLLGTAMVSLVLSLIVWLTQSLQFLQFVINKGLSLGDWLKLTTLLLPSFLGVILPIALFFVVVFVYNKLILDRELVVVQAAGVSRVGVATPALLAAAAAVAVGYGLSLFGVPAAYSSFKEAQWALRANVSQVLVREGTFNTVTDGLTIYVRDRGRGGELDGIVIHDTRQREKSVTLVAEHGGLSDRDDGPHLTLRSGSREELTRGTGNLDLLYFDSYDFQMGDVAADPGDRYADNRERPTFELLSLKPGGALTPRKVARMHAEAHERLVTPLSALGYTLMALAFLLTGAFDRRSQLERIGAAVATVIFLQAAALGAMNLAARTLLFVPLMYAVGLLPIAAGLYMIAAPDRLALPWSHRRGAEASI